MQRRTIFPKPVSTSGFHELGATKSFSNLCGEAAKSRQTHQRKSGLLYGEVGCNDNGHGFEMD